MLISLCLSTFKGTYVGEYSYFIYFPDVMYMYNTVHANMEFILIETITYYLISLVSMKEKPRSRMTDFTSNTDLSNITYLAFSNIICFIDNLGN